jgi:hypothetical protein
MSFTSATTLMLERLGFSVDAAACLTRDYGIDSLEEIAYLDAEGDVETTIKGATSTVDTVTGVT